MAQFMAMYVNAHLPKGKQPKKSDDFIIKSFWKSDVEQDVDIIKKAFGIIK